MVETGWCHFSLLFGFVTRGLRLDFAYGVPRSRSRSTRLTPTCPQSRSPMQPRVFTPLPFGDGGESLDPVPGDDSGPDHVTSQVSNSPRRRDFLGTMWRA